MKKLLLLIVTVVASLTASAQFYVGGDIGFGSRKSGGERTTTIKVMPEIGYNLTNSVAVGTKIGAEYNKTGGTKMALFNLDPYLRYTYYKSELVSLFVDGGVDLGIGKTSVKGSSSGAAVTYGVGFRPGIALTLNPKFSLVAHLGFLGYEGANHRAKEGGAAEVWGLDISNNLSFGFYYNF